MIVGIIQPNFVPWRGYFDIIDDVDLFIVHDNLQYTKGDWRNRNILKTASGTTWITVPVKYATKSQLICNTPIDYSVKWQRRIKNLVVENYRKAPFFQPLFDEFSQIIDEGYPIISELNIKIIRWIMNRLGIDTHIKLSSEVMVSGVKTERVVNILKATKATEYLSGPSGANYLEPDKFREAGISLIYKVYEYPPYPQQYGGFVPGVSVLDLLFNCGHGSIAYLKSLRPGVKVIT